VERLTQGGSLFPSGFSPDALHLLFSTSGVPRVASDIAMIALGKSDHPTPLMHTSFGESNGEFSPNGRWIAYQSDESGRAEVYLRPFPDVEAGRWQVSTNGGERPLWARNGRELFYVTPGGLMTVPIEPTNVSSMGKPERLLDDRYFFGTPFFQGRTYDVSPDGKRFLTIKEAPEESSPSRLVVVLNWTEELKRRVPAR
jgi:serine/threonine-protein kinase